MQRMSDLYHRCQEHELAPEQLSQKQLKELEPKINAEEAILVKKTGITNYTAITQTLIQLFIDAGGYVRFEQELIGLNESAKGIEAKTQNEVLHCQTLINCAGLYTDRIAKMLDANIDYQIIPFKGEYYRLPAKYNNLVKHLIYPIPDPALPFLGVHLTRMIDGTITVGPNAVLALAREGYKKWQFNLKDNLELLSFAGTMPLIRDNFRSGAREFKNSVYKNGYLALVQKYCAQIKLEDLQPYPSGIRAQAVDNKGNLIHDFKFFETEHSLHICNAPSPAATSAIPIAKYIVSKLRARLD